MRLRRTSYCGPDALDPGCRSQRAFRAVFPAAQALLILIALLLLPRAAHSQELVLGAKIGASFSRFSNNGAIEGDLRTIADFVGGAYARLLFGAFGVQTEALYATKGARFDLPGEYDVQVRLDYVEVPLLGVASAQYGRFAPYVMVGPTFAAEVGCKTKFFEDDIEVMFNCNDSEARLLIFGRNTVDIGVTLGGGVLVAVGPGAALVEARYTHGLTDINDSEFNHSTIHNRAAYLMVGYAYAIRRR